MRLFSLGALMVLLLSCVDGSSGSPPGPPGSLEGAAVTLTVSSGQEITNPSNEEIRSALAGLSVERDGEGFAILGPSDMTYIQVSGDRKIGFDMEYQDGDTDHHYRATRDDFSLDDVVDTFGAYRDGRDEWWHAKDWRNISW